MDANDISARLQWSREIIHATVCTVVSGLNVHQTNISSTLNSHPDSQDFLSEFILTTGGDKTSCECVMWFGRKSYSMPSRDYIHDLAIFKGYAPAVISGVEKQHSLI